MNTLQLIAAAGLLTAANTVFSHEASTHGNHGTTSAPASTPASQASPGSHDPHASHTSHTRPSAPQQQPWGIAGQAAQVQRTITLDMSDDMRFSPAHLNVRLGETLRLQVRNQGQVMHEIVLGTPQSLDRHAAQMLAQPGMAHDAPYMAHVAPGQSGELVWQFNRAGQFDFACLVAGHFQAGMRGTISVTP
ncbi:hypothetical protein MASR1M59_18240 [Melaminivora sp.]